MPFIENLLALKGSGNSHTIWISFRGAGHYNYDANGNRTSVVTTPPGAGPGTTATYTTGTNDLLQSDGQNTYTYDHEGNLSTATNIATGAYTVYGYDYRNRLTSVTTYTNSSEANTTESVTYTYDALDRRIGEVATGTTNLNEHFAYDGDQIVLQFNGSGQLTDRYLDGPAVDMVLADEQYSSPSAAPTTAGSVQWPLTDMLGSVRDLVNSSGTVIDHFGYDAYGNMSQTNAAVNYLFGYTGFVRDVATGQLLSMTRAYDSVDGNWEQQDPIGFGGGQANLSEYAVDSPATFVDATGLDGVAANELKQLVSSGQISQYEAELRGYIVNNALGSPVTFDTSGTRNPKYWSSSNPADPDAPFQFRPGKLPSQALSDIWSRRPGSGAATGCKQAGVLTLLKSIRDFAAAHNLLPRFNKILAERVPGDVAPFFETKNTNAPQGGFRISDLRPGDRVWFNNPNFNAESDPPGDEGSNWIYLGGNRFIKTHDCDGTTMTFKQARKAVADLFGANQSSVQIQAVTSPDDPVLWMK